MRYLYLLLALPFIAAGCRPEPPDYPDTPVISFTGFNQRGDTLEAVIHFTDGDGDLGAAPETAEPNLLLHFFHKNPSGQWVPTDGPDPLNYDTLLFPYQVPLLPASSQKTMEGDILLAIPKMFVLNDTILVTARLRDRAGHWSNRSTSPETIITR
jgi:hypothetical protein